MGAPFPEPQHAFTAVGILSFAHAVGAVLVASLVWLLVRTVLLAVPAFLLAFIVLTILLGPWYRRYYPRRPIPNSDERT